MADPSADLDKQLALLNREPENREALATLSKLAGDLAKSGDGLAAQAAERLAAARQALRERGDAEAALRLVDVELTLAADDGRRADVLLEKARILEDELLREPEAVETLKQVTELRPDDAAAGEMLAHIAVVSANWKKIVKKYTDEAQVSSDRSLATSLYLSAAEIHARHESDATEVEQYLRRALEVDPRNRRAQGHLERLLARKERWEELGQVRRLRVDSARTKEERVSALLSLADVAEQHGGRKEEALDAYRRLLAIDPGHSRALAALAAAYQASGDFAALVKLYETSLRARGRAADGDLDMLLVVGRLYWQKLGSMELAEEYYRRIRKIEPAYPEMLDFYRVYHAGRGEPQKLLAVLQQAQRVEAAGDRKLALAIEMAEAAENDSASLEKAIDQWKGVLRLSEPGSDPARRALEALRRLYQRTEKWNALLELLKEEIEALPAGDVETRIERYLQVVEIYRERLHLDVMVINTYNNILALRPDHLGALDALAERYETLGRWNDLIGVLTRKADVVPEAVDKAALLRRVAALWIERFGNQNQAVRPLERILEIAPGDAEATRQLKEIYTKRRMWRPLVELLEREASDVEGPARRERFVEIARLASERIGEGRTAIGAWNRVLELDARDPEALAQLAQLYEREKRWPALAEVLWRMRESVGADERAAIPLLERLGALYTERLVAQPLPGPAAHDEAVRVYREILSLKPGHPKAVRVLRELYADVGDADALEALYGGIGAWDELIETLNTAADRVAARDEKLQLLRRAADISIEKLRQPERATRALERMLQVDPTNLEAARRLVPVYQETEKWPRLLAALEVLLGAAASKEEKLALLADIRRLCEDRLGSKALAFQWCSRAYELAPEDAELARNLVRLAQEADAWEDLARVYRGRLEAMAGDEARAGERVATLRELARLLIGRLGRMAEARPLLEEILEREPEDAEARAALEQLFTQTQSWGDLLAIHRRSAERETDPGRRVDALFKIAFLEEERAGDLDAAVRTYEAILALEPSSVRALRALEKLHQARGAWPALATVYDRQVELAADDDEGWAALQLARGTLFETRLEDPVAATRAFLAVLKRQPGSRPAIAGLERLSARLPADSEDRVETARLLASLYDRDGETAKLAGELEVLRSAETDEEAGLAIDRRLVALYARKLSDPARAFVHGLTVLRATPGDRVNRREVAQIADAISRHADLSAAVAESREKANGAGDATLARELLLEEAVLADEKLGDADRAERLYSELLVEEPGNEGAYEALERLYIARERWQPLRELFERRQSEAIDPARRAELLYKIAELDLAVLNDQRAAVEVYERVLEMDPRQTRAYADLVRLHERGQRWPELEELLGRQGAFVDGPVERAALLFRRGDLRAKRLSDPSGAIDLYEEVLAIDRKHAGARKGLEELLGRADLRLRVARLLEPLYLEDGDATRTISTLRAQLEFARNPSEGVELEKRIARVEENDLGSRQRALATWREALRHDPADDEVRTEFDRLTGILGTWAEAGQAWEETLGVVPPGDLALRAEILARAARIYDQRLGDVAKATDLYRQLLEVDPGNVAVLGPAAEALDRLFTSTERWNDLVDLLRRQAEWSDDPDERKTRLFRIANLQEASLGDPSAAAATLREIFELDPAEIRALVEMERLHHAAKQWRELVDVLRRKVELAQTPEERRPIRLRIARLLETELREVSDAIIAYHELLDEAPEDREALGELARLYRQSSRWSDLLDVLERRLMLKPSPAERIALLATIADLLEQQLGRSADAFERYIELLRVAPTHGEARAGVERMLQDEALRLRAAEVLEPIYESTGQRDKLLALNDLIANHTSDPRERVARMRRVAFLYAARGEPIAAFAALSRAARAAVAEPELPEILAELERLTQARGTWVELVELYRELEQDVLDGDIKLRMCLLIADLARRQLSDVETAREYYRRVLDAQPSDEKALTALEEIYLARAEWEPLLEILLRRVEMAGADAEEKERRLLAAARLCEEKLGRTHEATLSYEQVLELAPTNAEAAGALERLYQDSSRWQELADLLDRRLGFADDITEAVQLRFRLGELWDKKLADPAQAVDNYSAVLGGDPGHVGAIAALERYLDDNGYRAHAAEVLEPVYAGRHDWHGLIRIYEIRLADSGDSAARATVTRRLARLYEEQLEDLDGAFRWYSAAFREEPADRWTRDQLVRLAGVLARWAELAELYAGYLQDTLDEGPATLDLVRQLAQIYDQRLGDAERARDAYRRILQAAPEDATTTDALIACLTRAQRWNDLLEVYTEAADRAADTQAKKTYLHRAATLYEEILSDRAQAIGTYRTILDLDGNDAQAIEALDRLLTVEQRWRDLAEMLERRLETAADPQAVLLRRRLAELLDGRLGDVSGAIDCYERILATRSADPVALAALERLVLVEEHRPRIAQILEPIYRGADEWAKLIVILDAQLPYIDDRPRRVEILHEIARLHETRGGRVDLAIVATARAFREDLTSDEDLATLERLAAQSGDWDGYVRELTEAAEGAEDAETSAHLLARVATVEETRRRDPAQAVTAWRRVLSLHDDDPEALGELERLFAALGRDKDLAEILERRAQVVVDPAQRRDLLARTAVLYEKKLLDPARALETWRAVLDEREDDREALQALARLYEQAKAYRERAEIYRRQIDLMSDPGERRALLVGAARLHEEALQEPLEAIESYRRVLEDSPDDLEALGALERLYQGSRQWPELLETLEAHLRTATQPELRAELLARSADVLRSQLGDALGAIERFRQVLAIDPRHGEARAALWAIARENDFRAEAAAILEPILRVEGAWDEVITLLDLRLAVADEPEQRRVLLGETARVHEERRRDVAQAFQAWSRAYMEAPGALEAEQELERLARGRGAFADLTACYEEVLATAPEPALARRLALRLATLYEEELHDAGRAASKLRQALEHSDDEREPLAALDRIFTKAGLSGDLAEVLAREAEIAENPVEQAGFLYRLGELREGTHATEAALVCYRDVLERDPRHEAARAALHRLLADETVRGDAIPVLEGLYEADEDFAHLLELLELRLTTAHDRGDRAQILERIAEVAETRLGDPVRALDAVGRALAEQPMSERLLSEIERLGGQTGRWPEVSARLGDVLASGSLAADPDIEGRISLRLGAILVDQLHDDHSAEARFRVAIRSDAAREEALIALEAIYRRVGDRAKLAETLGMRVELGLAPTSRGQVLEELASLREALGDRAGAITAWRMLLDTDDTNVKAQAALARLYEGEKRWEDLVAILDLQARFAESPVTQRALKARIADLLAERLKDLERAIQAYRDVVDLAPDDDAGLLSLERVLTRKEDWLSVQEVLVRRLAIAPTPAAKVLLLQRLAAVAEGNRQSVDEALGYYHDILDLDGRNQRALEALERILAKGERWHELVEVHLREAEVAGKAGDVQGEIGALARAADLWERRIGSPEAASDILERILAREPNHVPALMTLARIQESSGNLDACRETLRRALALAKDTPEAAELCFRLGQIEAQRTGEPAAGAPFFEEALRRAPGHVEALGQLESIARGAGDYEKLAELLSRREEVLEGKEKSSVQRELGEVLSERLGRPEAAIPVLERALGTAPNEATLMEPLAEAYARAGRHADAERLLEGLIAERTKARRMKDVARLQQRLGAMRERRGDAAGALRALEEAFRLDGTHAATLGSLGRLYFSARDWEKARRVYRSMLLQNLDPTAGITKAEVYLQLGLIHAQLGEGPKAKNMYERGLELEPANAALRQAMAALK